MGLFFEKITTSKKSKIVEKLFERRLEIEKNSK
jgi:hypothetical protein